MNVNKTVETLFALLIITLIAVELLPMIFEGFAGLLGVESEVPAWIVIVLQILVGFGLVTLYMKLTK